MPSVQKKLMPVLLLSGALLGLAVADLRAQVQVNPHVGNHPPASTQIGAAQAAVSQVTRGGTQPIRGVGYRGPVGGYYPYAAGGYYPGYGNTYVAPDPYSGYLNGAANVISSQAEFMKAQQEADLKKEEVRRSKLDTRKQTFEEWKYEQAALPTAEELRLKKERAEIDRARGNPPLTEIRSGDALNTLLVNIQKAQRVGVVGPTVPLEPEMLRHINVTDGRSNSGVGLMRDGGRLDWPYALQYEFFDEDRKRVEKLMAQAVTEARSGKVSFKVIKELLGAEDALRAQLKTHVHDLTPTDGINARRYLTELHDTIQTMQDPNVSKYLGGTWAAKGDNVGELVDGMTRQGLKFAPAAAGDDSYYRALYQALMAYDGRLAQLVSR